MRGRHNLQMNRGVQRLTDRFGKEFATLQPMLDLQYYQLLESKETAPMHESMTNSRVRRAMGDLLNAGQEAGVSVTLKLGIPAHGREIQDLTLRSSAAAVVTDSQEPSNATRSSCVHTHPEVGIAVGCASGTPCNGYPVEYWWSHKLQDFQQEVNTMKCSLRCW